MHGLQQDRPEHEMRRRLHRRPDVRVGQHRLVVVDADIRGRRVRTVGAVVGEREPDRPDQREDVDRQQQDDRRRDEQPGDGPIGQAAQPARQPWASRARLVRRLLTRCATLSTFALSKRCHVPAFSHRRTQAQAERSVRWREAPAPSILCGSRALTVEAGFRACLLP